MKCGFYQYTPEFGKLKQNNNKIIKKLDGVEADLIVLPELAHSGYNFESRKELTLYAENPLESENFENLKKLCKKNNFFIVIGFAEKAITKIYNSSALIGPNGIIDIYRKLHLFNREKIYFDSGNKKFSVHEIKGNKVGMMICFDWAFPEAARKLTLLGAEIIAHPSNLVLTFCQQSMKTRCLENNIYAITANRTGTEKREIGTLSFTGQSQITAPRGEIIKRADGFNEELFISELNIEMSENKKITERNHLIDDRRVEFY